jgi:trehalose 6-phosphate phosphatase
MREGSGTDLPAAIERLAATPTLLVALDFDGVLSPLVERAEDARPLPRSAAALKDLASLPGTTTALISGRALASLRSVASPEPETLLIGSHGAETWTGPGGAPLSLTAEQAALLRTATAAIEKVVADHPGTLLESKPAGVVLHTRTAADDTAAAAVTAAREALASLEGLSVTDGKRVLETSVVHADKGQGLRLLRRLSGATAVLFAGDDVTDEHAFRVLEPGDVGIKVGDGDTAAGFRVSTPEELAPVLEEVLALRRGRASA